jgi:hypothetical protein
MGGRRDISASARGGRGAAAATAWAPAPAFTDARTGAHHDAAANGKHKAAQSRWPPRSPHPVVGPGAGGPLLQLHKVREGGSRWAVSGNEGKTNAAGCMHLLVAQRQCCAAMHGGAMTWSARAPAPAPAAYHLREGRCEQHSRRDPEAMCSSGEARGEEKRGWPGACSRLLTWRLQDAWHQRRRLM